MKKIFSFFTLISFCFIQAQQLNCVVKVNAEQVASTNNQVFVTLQSSLNDFMNKTDWTGKVYKPSEKINCSMFINVTSYDSNQFTASIQVQSSRTIYDSTYSSPVFNYNDKDFNFNYVEFQNLTFNPSIFDSNLVSVISFYAYIIIGMDADTFSSYGGTSNFEIAKEISNVAQSSGYKGWAQEGNNQNRYGLTNDILSNTFSPYREAMFQYHFKGLDAMHLDLQEAKNQIQSSIGLFLKIYSSRPTAFLTRLFFDAKSDEIVSIFSGGPSIPIDDLVKNLNRLSSTNSTKWSAIKF